ncbi:MULTISPECIES: MFS transporter [unclassified Corynebacterium]|uniref:MFS transporter n=1 Tax=unclassified Corynebacterium TaxID=2624378 RepID=UPI0029C9D286|nr:MULTISPECIES: MFS transporter [unclassified Corynebacterium]WPF65714.1 MFS transporter [Corynebacterium sp. 22KM0430]WPF68209.1 MFS transporter [Corynebacterium sp. 21KM1197]
MRQRTWILLLIVMAPQLGLSLLNPANSAIAADLGATLNQVEFTLTLYMAGYALSMFLAGTLADRFDARRLQSLGLALFALGGLICAVAPHIAVLGAGRFLQALGGTSATVLCRIIVQRHYPTEARVGVLASMSMMISLTPALSPLLGGVLSQVAPWRVLFLLTAIFAVALIPLLELLLAPAAPMHPRFPTPGEYARALGQALGNKQFRWYACCICLVWMTYFGFIHSSSTLLQSMLGQSSLAYGALVAIPALGYLCGSMMVKRSSSLGRAVTRAVACGAIGLLLSAGAGLLAQPLALVASLAVAFIGVGAVIPYAQAGLLGVAFTYPGLSTGFFFFLQMASGALYGAVLSTLAPATVAALIAVILLPQAILTALFLSARLRGSGV